MKAEVLLQLDRLSLIRTYKGEWQANARLLGHDGFRVEIRDCPIEALKAVLKPIETEMLKKEIFG